jgi:hypothetical protein
MSVFSLPFVPAPTANFDKAPQIKTVYDRLVTSVREFGPVNVAPKQTSIHVEKNQYSAKM